MFDLSTIKQLSIPVNGISTPITQIADSSGNIIWTSTTIITPDYFCIESLEDNKIK